MSQRQPRPKLKKTFIATLQDHDVYAVNAFAVRDLAKQDEEFTNFAIHGDFPDLISEREIWVDERLANKEGLFYIANALTQLKEREQGAPEDRAYKAGLNVERALRERLVGVKYRAGRAHRRVPSRIYAEADPYVTLPDPEFPVDVWFVDGNLVRSFYKTDYTEGGHGYVYPWVPKDQIWVEGDLARTEIPYIVSHEYLELRLMRDKKLSYDRAHEICSRVEFGLREDDRIKSLVVPDGRRITRRELAKLASEEVFEFVIKNYVNK
jgi:hypothetical protein